MHLFSFVYPKCRNQFLWQTVAGVTSTTSALRLSERKEKTWGKTSEKAVKNA